MLGGLLYPGLHLGPIQLTKDTLHWPHKRGELLAPHLPSEHPVMLAVLAGWVWGACLKLLLDMQVCCLLICYFLNSNSMVIKGFEMAFILGFFGGPRGKDSAT